MGLRESGSGVLFLYYLCSHMYQGEVSGSCNYDYAVRYTLDQAV